jgi:DNA repair protein RecO (recombination protein O)
VKRGAARRDRAFVLRLAPYGEDDVITTLLAEQAGLVPVLSKHARSRNAGKGKSAVALEPFHTLAVELVAGSGELSRLASSAIETARPAMLERGEALERAGKASRWARELSPPHTPEPEVFDALERLLDALETGRPGVSALTAYGVTLLDALGWGLELARCARCGQERPGGRAAYVSAISSGVVCRACGGGAPGQLAIAGEVLDRAIAGTLDEPPPLDDELVAPLLRVVEDAIDVHARAVGARKGGA